MPRNKDLKRLVRARMSKTGESYTAARAHVLAKASSKPRATALRANRSRTYNVPAGTLFDAWANARVRGRWLDGEIGKVRTSTAAKSMRIDGTDGSIVAVGFWPKGPSKSAVSVQHTKLRDQETATKLKKYWGERLDALREVLMA